MGDWYYIGHYGQLGPLTREQMDELVQGGVVGRDTYVWHSGMTQWQLAGSVPDLAPAFRLADPFVAPPPPPSFQVPQSGPVSFASAQQQHQTPTYPTTQWSGSAYPAYATLKSDRNRTLAGVLQLLIPGSGRMYLGYIAYGVLQLIVTIVTCGIAYLWALADGIIILSGGVKFDGYGRAMSD